jgi:hypothetical protein
MWLSEAIRCGSRRCGKTARRRGSVTSTRKVGSIPSRSWSTTSGPPVSIASTTVAALSTGRSHGNGANTAQVETIEEWSDRLYDRTGREVDNQTVRERDRYTLQRINGQWRIVADQIEPLDVSPTVWNTVIVESLAVTDGKSRPDAEQVAAQVRANGLDAQVLLSTDYPDSLRPGYWVVYSGQYATQAEAQAHLSRVRAAGYPAAYLRQVDQ